MIVHEAATTFVAVYHALIGWLIFFATVAAVFVLAAIATGAWGARAASGRISARLRPEQRPGGSQSAETPERRSQRRRAPSWARTDHHTYEEAA